jgi:hypothetical protein
MTETHIQHENCSGMLSPDQYCPHGFPLTRVRWYALPGILHGVAFHMLPPSWGRMSDFRWKQKIISNKSSIYWNFRWIDPPESCTVSPPTCFVHREGACRIFQWMLKIVFNKKSICWFFLNTSCKMRKNKCVHVFGITQNVMERERHKKKIPHVIESCQEKKRSVSVCR